MKQLIFFIFIFLASLGAVQGQHHHPPSQPMPMDTMKHSDQTMPEMMHHETMADSNAQEQMHEHHDHHQMEMPGMTSAFSLSLPMTRNGSGTSWLPDASPMYAYMFHSKKWMYMVHGNLFVRYNHQDIWEQGSRGADKWDIPNMLMFMGQRKVGQRGLFHFNAMFSADALIAGGSGYPLLFQTGESWNDKPLIDRQHPHDLFSELSVSYAYSFNPKTDVYVYLGYPGEPAIGPPTFMHRPSGMDNPDAPLGHHWQDATHITFGVATLGFRYDKFKLELSSFTGREPNENRYNFDAIKMDSYSGRISFNPSKNWALQVSHGFLKSPEAIHPEEDIHRTTASVIYSYNIGRSVLINMAGVWGMNKIKSHQAEHSALAEGSIHNKRFISYLRYEWLQKSTEELNLDKAIYGDDVLYPVNAFTLGFAYDVYKLGPVRFAPGVQFSVYHAPKGLQDLYSNNPMAGEVYLRIYTGLMKGN